MILYLKETNKPYIMSIDVEYDRNKLLQVGAIIMQRIDNELYQTCRSFNIYLEHDTVSQFVQDYTNITNEFLHEYGISFDEAHES